MNKKYTEHLIEYIFGEISDYFEDRKLAYLCFKANNKSLTIENLDQLASLLKTELINFADIGDHGDRSWCPDPQKKSIINCWNAKIRRE